MAESGFCHLAFDLRFLDGIDRMKRINSIGLTPQVTEYNLALGGHNILKALKSPTFSETFHFL